MESRVIGALAYGTGYGALNWTEPALEVVEPWKCVGHVLNGIVMVEHMLLIAILNY